MQINEKKKKMQNIFYIKTKKKKVVETDSCWSTLHLEEKQKRDHRIYFESMSSTDKGT